MTSNSGKHSFEAPLAIFIGPQRAGTSWIHRYFSSRKDVCLPKSVKELFFFDFNFEQGEDLYFSHFKEEPEHKMVMEVSATYFMHPEAPKRIHEYFGSDIKLVCPLRHPIIRSYSLYNHFKRYGIVDGTLREACKKKPEIIQSSHYRKHLENWTKDYDLNDIYVCFQEDLAQNQEKFLMDLCAYLEIPYVEVQEDQQGYFNVATRPPVQIIANVVQKGAEQLRALQLYWVINFAKSIGLKRFVFGAEQSDSISDQLSPEDKRFLHTELDPQIRELENFLGYEIKAWQ